MESPHGESHSSQQQVMLEGRKPGLTGSEDGGTQTYSQHISCRAYTKQTVSCCCVFQQRGREDCKLYAKGKSK